MVTDIKKVVGWVARDRYVCIEIDPMCTLDSTKLIISGVKDDGVLDEAVFTLPASLLMRITNEDLHRYLVIQVDRFLSGQPLQRIKLTN